MRVHFSRKLHLLADYLLHLSNDPLVDDLAGGGDVSDGGAAAAVLACASRDFTGLRVGQQPFPDRVFLSPHQFVDVNQGLKIRVNDNYHVSHTLSCGEMRRCFAIIFVTPVLVKRSFDPKLEC